MGTRAEKFKSFLVATHPVIYEVLLLMLVIFGFFALRSWRNYNDMAGATSAKLNGILDKLDAKVEAVKIENVNDLLVSGKGRIDDLATLEHELTYFIADNRRNGNRLSASLAARVDQLGENLASLKGITDESRLAIASISDATVKLMVKFNLTADEATKAIAEASR